MRTLNGVFAALLILFAAVQWNDPDGLRWIVLYAVGAVWCVAAAWRPGAFRWFLARAAIWLTFLASVVGVAYYWPRTPGWWRQEVWWETETAREGMGMMILALALLLASIVAFRARQSR